jgi:excisionase family DNA binding protein
MPNKNTAEAAENLGVSPSRVRQLCLSGELAAEKVGRDWVITTEALEAYAARPKPKAGYPAGMPRKAKGELTR